MSVSVRGKIAGLPNISAFCSACSRLFSQPLPFFNRLQKLTIAG
ncbi:hypothetical protein CHCC5022_3092 [Bacillus paralicheniformis]|nr:hypothetical protein CHCC5027_4296 [Bacillus paralicheniformis]TWJ54046.1 hypothetical protein CHCC5022_3092 [Bacillus paralicheniformis]TWJ81065.1 hypothetical protein CHCC4186_0373 [Bacillus paralicheniformis]